MKEKQLIGIFIVLIIIFSFFLFLKIKKRRKEKKELEEKIRASEAHAKRTLENAENLEKFFADLALIPNEFLNSEDLQEQLVKRFYLKNHDLDKFIKVNYFLKFLENTKREIILQLLIKALTRRPSHVFGSLIYRSIIKSEIEIQKLLFQILKDLDPVVRWRVYKSTVDYMNKHFKKVEFLSEARKNKLVSDVKKVKHLVYNYN